jgi:hypothetical protein
MLLLMIAAIILNVASASREISARYPEYSGLYDMAVSGNERVFFLLREEFETRRGETDIYARGEVFSEDVEPRLIFEDGEFKINEGAGGYFDIFTRRADELLQAYIGDNYTRVSGGSGAYRLPWSAEISFPAEDAAITDVFSGQTDIRYDELSRRFALATVLSKSVNHNPAGFPATVTAEIGWEKPVGYEEVYIPVYGWRGPPAEHLAVNLYAAGNVYRDPAEAFTDGDGEPAEPPPLSARVTGGGQPLSDLLREESLSAVENHGAPVIIVTDGYLDISSLGEAAPRFIIFTGDGAEMYASDSSRNVFEGIAVSEESITLSDYGVGLEISGTVISGGDIMIRGDPVFTGNDSVLFNIGVSEAAQRDLFDFLGLTRFYEWDSGRVPALSQLLGAVRVENGGEIIINNFDDITPAMVKSKKIAD